MWANTKHSQLQVIAGFLLAISSPKQNAEISGHRLSVTLLDSEFGMTEIGISFGLCGVMSPSPHTSL